MYIRSPVVFGGKSWPVLGFLCQHDILYHNKGVPMMGKLIQHTMSVVSKNLFISEYARVPHLKGPSTV